MLVLGTGKTLYAGRSAGIEARAGRPVRAQDEDPGTQTVRMYGDTAIVTARLWLKYIYEGKAFERRLWFSDTYVRTPKGLAVRVRAGIAAAAGGRESEVILRRPGRWSASAPGRCSWSRCLRAA